MNLDVEKSKINFFPKYMVVVILALIAFMISCDTTTDNIITATLSGFIANPEGTQSFPASTPAPASTAPSPSPTPGSRAYSA